MISDFSPVICWFGSLPHAGAFLGEGGKFLLDAVHAVHRVNEQDKNEDECDLQIPLATRSMIWG